MSSDGTVTAVERAFLLVERLAEGPSGKGVLQLAKEAGLPPSTAHRMLYTLSSAGYVRQDGGSYRLTGKLLDLGSRAVTGRDLRRDSIPFLTRLREETGESAHLVVLDGGTGLTVESVLSEARNLVDSRVGERSPLHCTAVGKCLIAFLPDLEGFLSGLELTRFTEHTICTAAGMMVELDRVRETGCAFDWEENELGIRCVAAPVYNSAGAVVASIGISGPAMRIADEDRRRLAEIVIETGAGLSRAVGFSGTEGRDDR